MMIEQLSLPNSFFNCIFFKNYLTTDIEISLYIFQQQKQLVLLLEFKIFSFKTGFFLSFIKSKYLYLYDYEISVLNSSSKI